jgi:hypothetical protein
MRKEVVPLVRWVSESEAFSWFREIDRLLDGG